MSIVHLSHTTSALPFLIILLSSSFAKIAHADTSTTSSHLNISRSSFPPGFVFGVGSAAYQIEGAAFDYGKGPSIWDNFTHKFPEKIADRSNGDVANDFYHLYKEDVKSLKYIGVDSFRMSISWPRILPSGKLSGGVNKQGIAFYNNVFNELLANGIKPFVTLFHWDVPQALEDEYAGFLSPLIIDDFKDFAELCFKEFGDRVKHWATLNEPYTFILGGYDGGLLGNFAPGRCSDRTKCSKGNSATEPYIAAHNMLLSHAVAVKLYKTKYQKVQKGEIGITLVASWYVPYSNSSLDAKAAQRALDFTYGLFVDPIVDGEYPKTVSELLGNRLPKFSKEQKALLKGSFDFLGLNYYTGIYAAHQLSANGNLSYATDILALLSFDRNGVPIGDPTGSGGFYVFPQGFYDLLMYTKEKYQSPTIYITENGLPDRNHINDTQRIDFYTRHFQALRQAMRKGVNVKGFFAWTFHDDFEWGSGYTTLFGFYYVDRNNGLKRIPKLSAFWLKKFLAKNKY